MTLLTITVPSVTVEEMEAIWNACPDSTLTLMNGARDLLTQPLHVARLPQFSGDVVTSKAVLFAFPLPAKVNRWRAELFGKQRLHGKIRTIRVWDGDSISCSLTLNGDER